MAKPYFVTFKCTAADFSMPRKIWPRPPLIVQTSFNMVKRPANVPTMPPKKKPPTLPQNPTMPFTKRPRPPQTPKRLTNILRPTASTHPATTTQRTVLPPLARPLHLARWIHISPVTAMGRVESERHGGAVRLRRHRRRRHRDLHQDELVRSRDPKVHRRDEGLRPHHRRRGEDVAWVGVHPRGDGRGRQRGVVEGEELEALPGVGVSLTFQSLNEGVQKLVRMPFEQIGRPSDVARYASQGRWVWLPEFAGTPPEVDGYASEISTGRGDQGLLEVYWKFILTLCCVLPWV
ncbi:hypothetical protein B0T14DRAFT_516932 [Immersiella caudata]|uniref:Uncharacterized protein n=1 Tax=Immersiella caudata TaxID=314043 RepID=A0AA39WY24_9PEZI|nr:hypothetical protein B0T14DRAFT_516932 [Immersiella caudata]